MSSRTSLIVIGSLNTDIVASGLTRFPGPGEHVYGKQLSIGPGGKSRNIASMAAGLMSENAVAMMGRTAEDSFGFWKIPLDALGRDGVDTSFVHIVPLAGATSLPAIALIPVTEEGENQIIVLPGASADFSPEDVDAASPLFSTAAANHGYLAITLECPLQTVRAAFDKARHEGIRIVLDPGGITPEADVRTLLDGGIFLVKPNEHEAQMMTGTEVTDMDSAAQAAMKLRQMGAENVLITHGQKGAYLFGDGFAPHIPVDASITGEPKDATGCGDQTMATICAWLQAGKPLEEAARAGVTSGTIQFHKAGIQPVTPDELAAVGFVL